MVEALILFLMLRPLLKYKRRRAVAAEEPDALNPSLSEPLELLPPEKRPEPFSCAAALVAVGVDGLDLDTLLGRDEAFDSLLVAPGWGDCDWDWDWDWDCDWAGDAARGACGDLSLLPPDVCPNAKAIIAADRVLI